MSYHEIDLDRHSVTVAYGVSLGSWALPLDVGLGGSGLKERGFTISFLCFWFAMHWWPRDYAVPERARTNDEDGRADWMKRFEPERDFGYMLEGLDVQAEQIAADAVRIRNAVDVLRKLHDGAGVVV